MDQNKPSRQLDISKVACRPLSRISKYKTIFSLSIKRFDTKTENFYKLSYENKLCTHEHACMPSLYYSQRNKHCASTAYPCSGPHSRRHQTAGNMISRHSREGFVRGSNGCLVPDRLTAAPQNRNHPISKKE